MNAQTNTPRFEPRWPVALTVAAVTLVLVLLPDCVRLIPIWFTYAVGGIVLAPIAAVGLTAGQPRWLRIERVVILVFFVGSVLMLAANLMNLIYLMAHRSAEVSGVQLLASSIAVWSINVLTFSLMYWQLDRGGPEARVNRADSFKDWLFPQEGAPGGAVPAGWCPTFVDYLYLAYSTATAFSTTEVAPMSARAKLLMMLESMISLAVILVVAARSINILGG